MIPRFIGLALVVWGCFISAHTAKAEAWPSLDDLASPRFLLIVHCRVEELEGRNLYRVLDVWKGEYAPLAFSQRPPTGYINTDGPGGGAEANKPGAEVILVYTRHNQPKEGIERHDMILPVEDRKIAYPPGETVPFSQPREYTVEQFKQEITSRIVKSGADQPDSQQSPAAAYAGVWRMLLPAGFELEATLALTEKNRYRLNSAGSRFNGVYEKRGARLVAVEPEETRLEGYEWEIRSPYMIRLVKHSEGL